MPRGRVSHLAYWFDPNDSGLSGGPPHVQKECAEEPSPIDDIAAFVGRYDSDTVLTRNVASWKNLLDPQKRMWVMLVMRDRQGFRWERIIGLSDDVPLADGARLLGIPLMRLHRFIAAKEIAVRKKKDYRVVRVRDLYKLALRLQLRVPHGKRIVVVSSADDDNDYTIPQK